MDLLGVDLDAIDVVAHADGVMARELERGCLADVQWLIDARAVGGCCGTSPTDIAAAHDALALG